jgi:hypothetical protein
MSLHNELGSSLKKYLCWNKSRLDCFVGNVAGVAAIETYQSHPVGSSVWQSGGSQVQLPSAATFFCRSRF